MTPQHPDFIIIPFPVYQDRKLSRTDAWVYGLIYWYARLKNEKCYASNATFGSILGIHPKKVSESVGRLEKAGYVRGVYLEGKGGRRSIRTEIIPLVSYEGSLNRRRGIPESGEPHPRIGGTNKSSNKNINKNADTLRVSGPSKKKNMDDDVNYNIDEDGNEITHTRFGRPLKVGPKVKTEGRNKIALRIQHKFVELCFRELKVRPVLDIKGYRIVLHAMNAGGLTEPQIYDLFDEWFGMAKADDETVQITRALSSNNVNGYKARNQV